MTADALPRPHCRRCDAPLVSDLQLGHGLCDPHIAKYQEMRAAFYTVGAAEPSSAVDHGCAESAGNGFDGNHAPAGAHPIQLKPENVDNVAGKWVTNDLLLRSALWYASIGQPVFPCYPWEGDKAKSPLTTNGFHDATVDQLQIRKWWTQHPFAMIGGPVAVDEVCLDTDPRNGGNLSALIELASLANLPPTRTVFSGRLDGGQHQFFKRPEGSYDGAKARLPRGIDLKDGGKGYTVLPPSVHPDTGGVYFYRKGTRPLCADLPVEIHRILLAPPPRKFTKSASSNKPTSSRLRAICKRVAETPEGNRQTIGFQWAANILKKDGFPAQAWDLVEDAMREAGATQHDINTALRERPGGERVHA
jgi:Bifunctional DNA primase/polymerase, N-terminal